MNDFDENAAFEGASLSARAMAARPQPYLDGLNFAQREAVETMDGPVLMLAGAGTGKTRHLLEMMEAVIEHDVHPMEIGFASFTRTARSEAAERAGAKFGINAFDLEQDGWFRTVHSVA